MSNNSRQLSCKRRFSQQNIEELAHLSPIQDNVREQNRIYLNQKLKITQLL